jgi:hypothetical protein
MATVVLVRAPQATYIGVIAKKSIAQRRQPP